MTALTGAERTRRWRERRTVDQRSVRVEITKSDVAALVRRGLLHPARVEDRAAVGRAVEKFLDLQIR